MRFKRLFTKRHSALALVLSLNTLTTHGAEMNTLSDYQWKTRLIVVRASSDSIGEIGALRSVRAAVDDRDIAWFVSAGCEVVSNQGAVSSSLARDIKMLFEHAGSDERVLLIGKDGGIKSRESSLNLDAIFDRIDAMPMRRREMRVD